METTLPDFDKLWDCADPAATEKRFTEVLAQAGGERAYVAELLTQIARAQGLQGHFEQAHATLNRVETMLTDDMPRARVRYLLERGRVFNSSGHSPEALPPFHQAARLGEEATLPRFWIDAVHMIAIAEPDPRDQVEWNLKGIALAEQHYPKWLDAFYNNLGESYAKLGDYEKALQAFRKLEPDTYNLKDQSRMLRLLGRIDEAIAVIEPIQLKLEKGDKRDGWISEEYGECLLARGQADRARPHLASAYELLSQDPWVQQHDPAKLERLKRLTQDRT